MKITVLGTGMVGRANAGRLSALGHDVVMGTRNVAKTKAETEAMRPGDQAFADWHEHNKNVKLYNYHLAAQHGEIVFEALKGSAALSVLNKLGTDLTDKILIDITNPLIYNE